MRLKLAVGICLLLLSIGLPWIDWSVLVALKLAPLRLLAAGIAVFMLLEESPFQVLWLVLAAYFQSWPAFIFILSANWITQSTHRMQSKRALTAEGVLLFGGLLGLSLCVRNISGGLEVSPGGLLFLAPIIASLANRRSVRSHILLFALLIPNQGLGLFGSETIGTGVLLIVALASFLFVGGTIRGLGLVGMCATWVGISRIYQQDTTLEFLIGALVAMEYSRTIWETILKRFLGLGILFGFSIFSWIEVIHGNDPWAPLVFGVFALFVGIGQEDSTAPKESRHYWFLALFLFPAFPFLFRLKAEWAEVLKVSDWLVEQQGWLPQFVATVSGLFGLMFSYKLGHKEIRAIPLERVSVTRYWIAKLDDRLLSIGKLLDRRSREKSYKSWPESIELIFFAVVIGISVFICWIGGAS